MAETKLPEFVLNRSFTVFSKTGFIAHFEKGVPRPVPAILIPEVVAIGAERVDDEQGAGLGGDEKVQTPDPVGQERTDLIHAAFEDLITKNSPNDFAASGVPKLNVVKKVLGFTLDNDELTKAWIAFQGERG